MKLRHEIRTRLWRLNIRIVYTYTYFKDDAKDIRTLMLRQLTPASSYNWSPIKASMFKVATQQSERKHAGRGVGEYIYIYVCERASSYTRHAWLT